MRVRRYFALLVIAAVFFVVSRTLSLFHEEEPPATRVLVQFEEEAAVDSRESTTTTTQPLQAEQHDTLLSAAALLAISNVLMPATNNLKAFQTFQEHLEKGSLESLRKLSTPDLCNRRFVAANLPNSAWGNSLNELISAHYYSLLSNRSIVMYRASFDIERAPLIPKYPNKTQIIDLLSERGCNNTMRPWTTIHLDELHDRCNDPSRIKYRFVELHRSVNWLVPALLESNVYIRRIIAKMPQDMKHLIEHPAFAGIVLLGGYSLAPVIATEVEKLAREWRGKVEYGVHLRHRQTNFESNVVTCLLTAAGFNMSANSSDLSTLPKPFEATTALPPAVGFMASDIPSSVDSMRELLLQATPSLDVRFVNFNFSLVLSQQPDTAISLQNLHAGRVYGSPGTAGWWGPDPTSVALLDLYALAAICPKHFIGSGSSSFSEVAIGLMLALCDKDNQGQRIILTYQRTCPQLTPLSFSKTGIQFGLPKDFKTPVCSPDGFIPQPPTEKTKQKL